MHANSATGYVNQIFYSDASCVTPTSQEAIACGICYETGLFGGSYSMVECGSSSGNNAATVISYTDQTCQTKSQTQPLGGSIILGCQPGFIAGSTAVSVSDTLPTLVSLAQVNTVSW